MRCEATVFSATVRAYCSLLTGSGTSGAYVTNLVYRLVYRSYVGCNCICISFSIHKKLLHFSKLLRLKSSLISICNYYRVKRHISLQKRLTVYGVNRARSTGDLENRGVSITCFVLEGDSYLLCHYST